MSRYAAVQKLLSKVAVRRFMENFRRKVADLDLTDTEFSRLTGRHPGAFNKTINEAEDLRLSSFLRYWNTALSLSTETENPFDFNLLMNDEVRKILFLVRELAPSEIGDNAPNIKSKDLVDLSKYVDLLVKQKAVSEKEREEYFNLIEELKRQEEHSEN